MKIKDYEKLYNRLKKENLQLKLEIKKLESELKNSLYHNRLIDDALYYYSTKNWKELDNLRKTYNK